MKRLVLSAVILAACASLAVAPQKLKPEQVQRHTRLEVTVPDFPADGLILDIGGRGDGVGLAKAAGFQIVSRKDEQGWFMLEMKKGD